MRQNIGGKLQLLVYGKVITGQIDPIEKKPVVHYNPGSKIFSIATTGCSWACTYCFTPETFVFTDRGMKNFAELFEIGVDETAHGLNAERTIEGHAALTHRGRFRKIKQVFRHFYDGPILAIKPVYLPAIRCTPDHKILATSITEDPPTMIEARYLTSKSYVVVPKIRDPTPTPRLDLAAFLGHEDLGEYKVARAPTVIEGRTVVRHSDYMLNVLEKNSSMGSNTLEWEDIRSMVVETPVYYLVPVRSTKTELYSGFVYNMEVEEDHTYIANLQAVSNCQNAEISQRRKPEGIDAMPSDIVGMALSHGCQGLAYTYNQPTIFIEYARDVGVEARKAGLMNIFVSNGYDTPDAVGMMDDFLDCITVDFKGNGETRFLRKYVMVPDAQPIFQTLLDIRDKTKVHTEITDLVIPEVGDNLDEAKKLCTWLYDNLGPDVPIHFLRFHPDYKMMHIPETPIKTLEEHCKVARSVGLRYVYVGNVPGHPLENTYCPGCGKIAVKRYGYNILDWRLDEKNRCVNCGYQLPIVGGLSRSYTEDRFLPVLN